MRGRTAGCSPSLLRVPTGEHGTGSAQLPLGLLTNLLHPKIIVFYVTFLPRFVGPGLGSVARTGLLAALFLVMTSGWLLTYVVLLQCLRGVLFRAAVRRRVERVTGVVLVGLGVRLAVAGARQAPWRLCARSAAWPRR
jgi:threonine/homoserine/homoserine lactone efflux protein